MSTTETQTDKELRWEKARILFEALPQEKQQQLKDAVTCDPIEWLMLIVK